MYKGNKEKKRVFFGWLLSLLLFLPIISISVSTFAANIIINNPSQGVQSISKTKVFEDVLVNTEISNIQELPSVGVMPNGNFVVVWQSDGQDGSGYGVFGQLFNKFGVKIGSEFMVNEEALYNQYMPSVDISDNGTFVVVWTSYGQDEGPAFNVEDETFAVYARIFDMNANPITGEFQVNQYTQYDQMTGDVVINTNLSLFVVTWVSEGQANGRYRDMDIYARIYDFFGNPMTSEFLVNDEFTFSTQRSPAVSMNSNGEIVFAWSGFSEKVAQSGYELGIYARKFDIGGVSQGSTVKVVGGIDNSNAPSVGISEAGNFVVAWTENLVGVGSFPNPGVYFRMYDTFGNALGNAVNVGSEQYSNRNPKLSVDNIGNFLITWTNDGQDGSVYGIFAQKYDSNGNLLGNEFQVNKYYIGFQSAQDLDMTGSGDKYIIAWSGEGSPDHTGVYISGYDLNAGKLINYPNVISWGRSQNSLMTAWLKYSGNPSLIRSINILDSKNKLLDKIIVDQFQYNSELLTFIPTDNCMFINNKGILNLQLEYNNGKLSNIVSISKSQLPVINDTPDLIKKCINQDIKKNNVLKL